MYSEIDWFNSGLGVVSIDDVYTRLVFQIHSLSLIS